MLILHSTLLFGQDQLLQLARDYYKNQEYDKAAETFKQLWEFQPKNQEIFKGYYQSLLKLEKYNAAEKLIVKKIKKNKSERENYLLLSSLYQKTNNEKKLKKALKKFSDGQIKSDTKALESAMRLEEYGFNNEAIALLEKSRTFNNENPYLFAEQMAYLYAKTGDVEKGVESLLDLYVTDQSRAESIKGTFQDMLKTEEQSSMLKKKVLQRSARDPEVLPYYDLLSWIFIQQGDYVNAFRQVRSIDRRINGDGGRVLVFARTAFREKKYQAAADAYEYLVGRGTELPYFQIARSEYLGTKRAQLISKAAVDSADVNALDREYEKFLDDFPAYRLQEVVIDYADMLARYGDNIPKAIEVLQKTIDQPRGQKQFRGRCKLNMGDYELIRGNVWESSLLYSQVDKDFKQDMLGQEAQLRNAKLSYYNGDFKWAQTQLDILKASTSELISNDAIDLSVLIIENNPIKDSNDAPLKLFAKSDLLVFQNKYEDAIMILDGISHDYPYHPLMDDILMQRADISVSKQEYNDAARFLQKIVDDHGDDVLGDDALYRLAGIYQNEFENPSEAKRLYEQLILDYPGSTFSERARKEFRKLRGDLL